MLFFGRSGELVDVPNILLFPFPILEFVAVCTMIAVTSCSDQVHRKAFLAMRQPGSPFCVSSIYLQLV
jgi:hypothetical protein